MRAAGLRIALVRLHLHRMDQVGKLDRILNEEHRDVVSHQIPIARFGIDFTAKPRTSRGVSTLPVPPATVEKRAKRGVSLPFSAKIVAQLSSGIGAVQVNTPCAPDPRA